METNTNQILNIENLIEQSQIALQNSNAKFSNFNVGAALLAKSGKIYLGANQELASCLAPICAERVALCSALMNGEKDFEAICITSKADFLCYPCGVCRQALVAFNPKLKVIVAINKDNYKVHTLEELLPNYFGE